MSSAHTTRDYSGRKAVIFDFDGTLADTAAAICSTAKTVLARHRLSPEQIGDAKVLVGPPFPEAFVEYYGFDLEEAKQITEEYRLIYRTLGVKAWPLFDGIAPMLRHLRAADKLCAVASSKQTIVLEHSLADNDALELFDAVEGKNDDADTKVGAIARAMERLSVSSSEAIMVGDRNLDVLAAAKLGLDCVGVLYGGSAPREEFEEAGAAVIVETVAELEHLLIG